MIEQPLFCAIDAGTSGVKVGLVDLTGRLVKVASRSYGVSYPRPDWVEQSVEELFNAECEALHELLHGIDPSTIAAVCCSSQRATFLGVEQGRPYRQYIGWQDQRGLTDCEEGRALIGDAEFHRRTGLAIDSVASWSKMRWLQRSEDQPDCFMTHQSMLLQQLGVQENLCSPSEASYVGLFDVRDGTWDEDLCRRLGFDSATLPTVVASGTTVGEVANTRVIDAGLPAGTPVVMGGGDLQLGVLGVGATEPGIVASGIGTGGHCVTTVSEPVLDEGRRLNCLHHVLPGTWEVEGLARASGAALRWMRDSFANVEVAAAERTGYDAYDMMTREAGQWPAGSGGLIFIPALAGLGFPMDAPEFSGTLLGLRLRHDRAAVTRSLMEGVCYEQRSILDSVSSVCGLPTEVRAWGGGAQSDMWCQMQADIYDVPVSRMAEPESSLIGAAVCAAAATGYFPTIQAGADAMVTVDRHWDPNPSTVAVYADGYQVYQLAVSSIIDSGLSRRLKTFADRRLDSDAPASFTEK